MAEQSLTLYLEPAFGKDFKYTGFADQVLEFYVHDMGNINITDGKIIACDPMMYHEEPVFEQAFPTGTFPVQLSIAKIDTDERVAFARINFAPELEPVTWDIAVIPGQDASILADGEMFGYPVDTGSGAFMDAAAGQALGALMTGEGGDTLPDEMEVNYKDTWSYLLKEVDGHTIALFSAGWGDGVYPSYIGKDANGVICRLVTNFGLIGIED